MNVAEKFYIDGDYIVRETVQSIKDDIATVRRDIVMDKATFKECYKKWILEDEVSLSNVIPKAVEAIDDEREMLTEDKNRIGEWQRMSNLPEDEDDRYQCSRCGNVVHFSSKVNLYTFSRWCGKCGSNNGRR